METSVAPRKIYLKDYRPPSHQLLFTELWFDLQEDHCRVRQLSEYQSEGATELSLDGEELELKSLKVNGQAWPATDYSLEGEKLRIKNLPKRFTLEIENIIHPEKNTALAGLYKSGGYFCTQCEAEGFRRITYFLDRPDVMTTYTVHVEADEARYPVLLSNGNRLATKKLAGGRHQITWQDPFKKPCYLFALVAGDLGVLKDQFVTMSGKKVDLEIYSPAGTQERCRHAMESLKKSMRWDEERFGREYDLSTFMILAVDDFNMGAMENKGLNIFNSRLIFADPQTATDTDYFNIEAVVGHEYFHNWTGNRVTVRDWFHLSLKEGLTVFRDQEFSGDMSSREMVRINNVADLRSSQFAEDAGPNSHPIRPESCFAVDNFYTSTIYEKGAEIIRMMQTMVGRPGFRRGMDLYFERFDGQAVIIEDFAKAISDANDQNWEQFKLWYSRAGTPKVAVHEKYDPQSKTYSLTLTQDKGLHIPLVFALLDSEGKEIPLEKQAHVTQNTEGQWLLHLKEDRQTWNFSGLKAKPLLSINRQFSAPIHLEWEASTENLLTLMAKDADSFNRWEAAQKIEIGEFKNLLKNADQPLPSQFLKTLGQVLNDQKLPEDYRASFLSLPDNSYLSQLVSEFDSEAFLRARNSFEKQIAVALEPQLLEIYQSLHGKNLNSKDAKDFGRRSLKNSALAFLAHLPKHLALVERQFDQAQIMTDEQLAFALLLDIEGPQRKKAIDAFYTKWKSENLVLNKWFQTQALSIHPETFTTVVKLTEHPSFQLKNPNRVYSLLSRFGENLIRFHDPAHDTYTFMADQIIEIDKLNPQVATRVAGSFDFWKKLKSNQKDKAHTQLERMLRAGLSKNTYEIVSKQLS